MLLRAPAVAPSARTRHRLQRRCASVAEAPSFSAEEAVGARAHYQRHGWVHVRGVLSAAEVDELQAAADSLERAASSLEASANLQGVYCEVQSASGRKGEPAVTPGALRKLTRPSRSQPAFAALRCAPRLLGLLSSVCGVAAPLCVADQLSCKPALIGTGFPWHQDAAFLVGHAAACLKRHGGANVALALDRSDALCGGFELLGGTHAQGSFHDLHGRYDTGGGAHEHEEHEEALFDQSHRACPTLLPSDAVIFHPLLAHGSAANRSGRRRRLATLWFVGTG